MPILNVRALPQKPGVDVSGAAKKVCSELARLLDLPSHQVWCTWETTQNYFEGDREARVQPDSTHPPIIELIAFEGRSQDVVEKMLTCVSTVLSKELQIEDGNLFIHFNELKSARLFNGEIVRRR